MKTLTIAAAVLAIAATQAASQQRNCAPRDVVLEHLADRFGETRRSVGLAAENRVVESFANAESGSWTITVTLANGMTCLLASGMAWEGLDEALPASGDDV